MKIIKEILNNVYDIKKEKRLIASKINKCFDPNIQTIYFNVNGQDVKTSDGEFKFYKSSDIDKSIKKLNKLIKELEK